MYQLNELDLRRERHHELLRKAESNRLARRLRSSYPKKILRVRSALAVRFSKQRLDAPADLRARNVNCA
jgi:hypothetical protein